MIEISDYKVFKAPKVVTHNRQLVRVTLCLPFSKLLQENCLMFRTRCDSIEQKVEGKL